MTVPPPLSLSIVIPTKDTRELTLRALRSVDATAVELVVVDDGSRDGTDAAVRAAAPSARLLRRATSGGFSAAVNQGVAATTGDLVLILNSDAELSAGALSTLLAAFAERPELGVAGARLVFPDGRAQWSGGRWPTALWLAALASGLPPLLDRLPAARRARPAGGHPSAVDWVSGTAMTVRREVWTEVGPFDEGYQFYGQDLELCWAARRRGWAVALLPELSVVHHHGATIAAATGSVAAANPAFLWADLIRFVSRSRGPIPARRAAMAMRAAGAARVVARSVVTPFVPVAARPRWRTTTAAYRTAVRALSPPPD